MATPEKPKKPLPSADDFLKWVEGRTGYTLRQFFDVWIFDYNLTPKEIEEVWNEVKKKAAKKPPKGPKIPPEKKVPPKPKVPPELLIERIPYPRWWRDSLNAKIELTAPGSRVLAVVTGSLNLWVATIVLTVTGETVITIRFGNAGSSGPIYLGGVDEPKGIVAAMGNSPAPCGDGNLTITATDPNDENPKIGGWATCFVEERRGKVKK